MMTDRVFHTDAEAIAYLSEDGGGTPCSRYGRNGAECAPIAAAVARILEREIDGSDAVTAEHLEHAMGLVVNDHPDPAITLVQHGLDHGYDARELLGDDVLEATILDDIPFYYDSDTRDALAAVWGIAHLSEEFRDDFIRGYLECAVWASTDTPPDDPDSEPEPLDDQGFTVDDIPPDALASMTEECDEFLASEATLLAQLPDGYGGPHGVDSRGRREYRAGELAGHDFWLTRNRHGAGFWDRGLGHLGDDLTLACRPYGESHLLIDDAGELFYTG